VGRQTRALPVNSTDQGIVWSGATSFNASASWFVCLSCNVLLLFLLRVVPGLKGGFSDASDFGAQGILLLTQGERKESKSETGGSDVCNPCVAWIRHHD